MMLETGVNVDAAEDPPDFVRTGPGTLAGRFMRTFWQPVYAVADLPPGRAVPIRIMGEDFTLYRGGRDASSFPLPLGEGEGEGATPHLLAFRCAHRGTQLSTGWVEGDNLRCFYHGWTYGPDGQCIEQPAEPEPFCQKIRIRSYPTREYLGLVFAYLGEGEPPDFPRYPEFDDFEGIVEPSVSEIWPCNFFNRVDNSPDEAHVTFAHRQLGLTVPRITSCEETAYGIETKGYNVGDGRPWSLRFHMPNANHSPGYPSGPEERRWRDHLYWRVPIDDTHYQTLMVTLIHLTGDAADRHRQRAAAAPPSGSLVELGNEILAGRLRFKDIGDRLGGASLVDLQDYVVLVAQGPVADRAQEHLGRQDLGIVLLRKIWTRELRKLAEGRPLKGWTHEEGTAEPIVGTVARKVGA